MVRLSHEAAQPMNRPYFLRLNKHLFGDLKKKKQKQSMLKYQYQLFLLNKATHGAGELFHYYLPTSLALFQLDSDSQVDESSPYTFPKHSVIRHTLYQIQFISIVNKQCYQKSAFSESKEIHFFSG